MRNKGWAALALCLLAGCQANLDTSRPRAYRCDRDGGDERQCAQGWHCGLEGYCYDLAISLPYRCEAAGGDCAPGWRCGREGTCHDQDAGAAYLCAQDPDCERGWRCGPDGRCVDPSEDALRPLLDAGTLSLINPRLLSQAPELSSLSPEHPDETDFGSLAWTTDAGLVHVLLSVRHLPNLTSRYDYQTGTSPLPQGKAQSLVTSGRSTFLRSGSQALEFRLEADGGLIRPLDLPVLSNGQLRISPEASPLVAEFTPTQVALARPGLDAGGQAWSMPRLDGGTQRILDLDFIFSPSELLAAADEGLFLATPPSDGGAPQWRPVQTAALPNSRCGTPANDNRVVKLHPLKIKNPGSNGWSLVVEVEPRGGAIQPSDHRVFWYLGKSGPGPSDSCAPSEVSKVLEEKVTSCAPCLYGPTLSLQPYADPDGGVHYEVLCGQVGAPMPYLAYYGADCQPLPLPSPAPTFSQQVARHGRSGAGFGTYAGSRGQLWLADPNASFGRAFVLDRVPDAISSAGGQMRAFAGDEYLLDATLGLVRQPPASGFARAQASVQGQDGWLVVSDPVGLSPGVGVVAMNPDGSNGARPLAAPAPYVQVRKPITAAAVGLPDGTSMVLVSVYDALLAASLAGKNPQLAVVAVPLPQQPITSLATLPPSTSGTSLLSAYALSEGRLFRVTAQNVSVWRSDEIPLPPGVPLRVWADGARGRVGYTDGTVYSLPSRVKIGAALLPAEGPVVDYAQVCGQSYALSLSGLYALSLEEGSPIGVWRRELRLEALLSQSGEAGYGGGRLHPGRQELGVYTAFGAAVRLALSCP